MLTDKLIFNFDNMQKKRERKIRSFRLSMYLFLQFTIMYRKHEPTINWRIAAIPSDRDYT